MDKQMSYEELQRAKLLIEYEELQRTRDERLNSEQISKNARLSVSRAVREKEQSDAIKQQMCDHKKPNGTSALAGQRDHHNVTHLMCQFCAKEFTGWNEVPPHLHIDINRVGGPEVMG